MWSGQLCHRHLSKVHLYPVPASSCLHTSPDLISCLTSANFHPFAWPRDPAMVHSLPCILNLVIHQGQVAYGISLLLSGSLTWVPDFILHLNYPRIFSIPTPWLPLTLYILLLCGLERILKVNKPQQHKHTHTQINNVIYLSVSWTCTVRKITSGYLLKIQVWGTTLNLLIRNLGWGLGISFI